MFGFVETSVITAVSARPHDLCAVGRKAADAHVVELSAGLLAVVTASHSGQCADAAAQDRTSSERSFLPVSHPLGHFASSHQSMESKIPIFLKRLSFFYFRERLLSKYWRHFLKSGDIAVVSTISVKPAKLRGILKNTFVFPLHI